MEQNQPPSDDTFDSSHKASLYLSVSDHRSIVIQRRVGCCVGWFTTERHRKKGGGQLEKTQEASVMQDHQLSHIHLLFLLLFVCVLLRRNCGGLLLRLLWLHIVLFRQKSVLQARSRETVLCKVTWKSEFKGDFKQISRRKLQETLSLVPSRNDCCFFHLVVVPLQPHFEHVVLSTASSVILLPVWSLNCLRRLASCLRSQTDDNDTRLSLLSVRIVVWFIPSCDHTHSSSRECALGISVGKIFKFSHQNQIGTDKNLNGHLYHAPMQRHTHMKKIQLKHLLCHDIVWIHVPPRSLIDSFHWEGQLHLVPPSLRESGQSCSHPAHSTGTAQHSVCVCVSVCCYLSPNDFDPHLFPHIDNLWGFLNSCSRHLAHMHQACMYQGKV